MTETTRYALLDSPLGPLLVAGTDAGLTGLYTPGHGVSPEKEWTRDDDGFPEPAAQLAAYFAGERRDFTLDLAPAGTAFQRSVWDQLAAIPYGETVSYGELARRCGRASAARAVGAAVGRNPLSIVVPCHRVVGANRTLTGYAGGLPTKARLLELESAALLDTVRPVGET